MKCEHELFNHLRFFMMDNDWSKGKTAEQAKAMFTTFCLVSNFDANSMDCASFLWILYTEANMKKNMTLDEFESFMTELIV